MGDDAENAIYILDEKTFYISDKKIAVGDERNELVSSPTKSQYIGSYYKVVSGLDFEYIFRNFSNLKND